MDTFLARFVGHNGHGLRLWRRIDDMDPTRIEKSDRELLLRRALGRWDNEGGATGAGPQQDVHRVEVQPGVPPLTNAELVQLQVRVIALENLVTGACPEFCV